MFFFKLQIKQCSECQSKKTVKSIEEYTPIIVSLHYYIFDWYVGWFFKLNNWYIFWYMTFCLTGNWTMGVNWPGSCGQIGHDGQGKPVHMCADRLFHEVGGDISTAIQKCWRCHYVHSELLLQIWCTEKDSDRSGKRICKQG